MRSWKSKGNFIFLFGMCERCDLVGSAKIEMSYKKYPGISDGNFDLSMEYKGDMPVEERTPSLIPFVVDLFVKASIGIFEVGNCKVPEKYILQYMMINIMEDCGITIQDIQSMKTRLSQEEQSRCAIIDDIVAGIKKHFSSHKK